MEDRAKARSALNALEDLLSSDADWKMLPSVVRVAFQAACALAKHTAAVNDRLADELSAKVDKEDMKKAFKFKANLVDVEESLERVAEVLESKVSVEDLDGVLIDYVRNDENMPLGIMGTDGGIFEERIRKLEDMAFTLGADESENYTSNFVTRPEFRLLEEAVQKCGRSTDLEKLRKDALTRQQLDKIISDELLPDLADQMRDIQQKTKEKLGELIQELETRVNMDDFSAIRQDIERLLTDRGMNGGSSNITESLNQAKNEITSLERRLKDLEKLPQQTENIRKDIQSVATVNREIQDNLDRIAHDLVNLPVTARVREMDTHLSSSMKSVEVKIKRLEAGDKRTQEILEILSKSKLRDRHILNSAEPGVTNRSGSIVESQTARGQPLVEQIDEIKAYVDKRVRKIEALHARQEDLDKLEDKLEESETTHNRILDTLKDMIGDLNAKLKSNCRFLEDKIDQLRQKGAEIRDRDASKVSLQVQLNDSSKLNDNSRSHTSADKLKNLDSLISKVSGLVDKRAKDDLWKEALTSKLETLLEKIEEKADKTKICKLIDRKAGKLELISRS